MTPVRDRDTPRGSGPETADLAALGYRLRREISGEVHTDLATRALYTSDASNYRVLPALVVAPRTSHDLAALLVLSSEAGVPVTLRGAGTSVAGNACGPGIVVDTSRHLTAVLDIDPTSRTAVVEGGLVLDELNRRVARLGLRVGPDPSTHSRCTIGGMIGNNACGARSIRWGTTAESIRSLEVALPDGTVMTLGPQPALVAHGVARPSGRAGETLRRLSDLVADSLQMIERELPPWPRRVSGYALDWLLPERGGNAARALVGSEGTCAVVLTAVVSLVEPPRERVLLVLGFPQDVAAAEAAPRLVAERPFTVEGFSAGLLRAGDEGRLSELLPPGGAWLMVEAGGSTPAEAEDHARRLAAAAGRRLNGADTRCLGDPLAQAELWRAREEGAGRATRLPDGRAAWPGFEDAVVPPERLGSYLAGFHSLLRQHGLQGTTFGHFGEGCIHVRIGFDFRRLDGVARFRSFMSDAAELVVKHGGSISGEHGDGRARSELLPRLFSSEMLGLFRRFKAVWDPNGVLNPGIIVDPAPLDRALRPATPTIVNPRSSLMLEADGTGLDVAALRCVGVGKCIARGIPQRMCPSYQVTGNERDSTRGRARLLQEMLAGSLAPVGWRSREVREALDLCLSCKACVSDCPTGVDMAAYKSEFLHRHYRGRLRPRSHYALGWLPTWLRLAQHAPGVANWLLHRRWPARLLAALGGLDPDRPLPTLTRRTFLQAQKNGPLSPPGPRGPVTLWPDTFNNHFTPEVLEAGRKVLAAFGFKVRIPAGPVCCGLTWTTTGQLDRARRVLQKTLGVIGDGDEPVVVLEPSCAASLRSDLTRLLPTDPSARRLAARVHTLADILEGAPLETAAREAVSVVLQPHCHQQAVIGTEADREVLRRAGVTIEETVQGCCGLAGSFGMERGHAGVSRAVAGLSLLPALERAAPDAAVLADGFSCRTQIQSLTGRHAVHLAQLLAAHLESPPG